jgi:hypothetical protein
VKIIAVILAALALAFALPAAAEDSPLEGRVAALEAQVADLQARALYLEFLTEWQGRQLVAASAVTDCIKQGEAVRLRRVRLAGRSFVVLQDAPKASGRRSFWLAVMDRRCFGG